MKTYKTVEEITRAFIKKGWNAPTFRETTEEEKRTIFGALAPQAKLFTMIETGNIFDDTGKIYYYNLKAKGAAL